MYLQNPAISAAPIVNDTPFVRPCAALFIGIGGNINVIMKDGTTVLFTNVITGTILPIRATQVVSTSTTATNCVALFN